MSKYDVVEPALEFAAGPGLDLGDLAGRRPLRVMYVLAGGEAIRWHATVLGRLSPWVVNALLVAEHGIDLPEGLGARVERVRLPAGGGGLSAAVDVLRGLPRLRQLVQERGIEVVHTTDDPRAVALAGALAAREELPLVIQHGALRPPLTWWARRFARRAALHLAPSVHASERIALELGVPEAQLAAVAGGVETDRFHAAVEGTAQRAAFGVGPDEVLAVQVGSLHPDLRQDDFIRAMGLARRRVPALRAVLVGPTDRRYPGPFNSYVQELEQLVCELRLESVVRLVPGQVDPASAWAAADLAVVPSGDATAMELVSEAMACGRALIAVGAGGVPDVVAHGETGLLCRPMDVEDLSERIVQLARDPDERRRLGQAAATWARAFLSGHRVASELVGLYRQLVRGEA